MLMGLISLTALLSIKYSKSWTRQMVEKVQPFIYQSTHLYIAVRPGLMHVNLLLLGNYAVLHRTQP